MDDLKELQRLRKRQQGISADILAQASIEKKVEKVEVSNHLVLPSNKCLPHTHGGALINRK